MIARYLALAGLFLLLQISSVWAGETLLQRNWGESYESQKKLQTANPEPLETPTSPCTLDGGAAKIIMDRYRASFRGSKSGSEQEPSGTFAGPMEAVEVMPGSSPGGGGQ